MQIINNKYFSVIYHDLLKRLIYSPEYKCSPRGEMIHEFTNIQFKLEDPYSCMYINKRRSSQFKYIAAELLYYINGNNKSEFISKYASLWNKLKNDNDTINSSYGYLIFNDLNLNNITQWQWSYESLKKDKDSRQAILHFNNSSHQVLGVKDFPCTMYGIFNIRNNILNFSIYMRSNDLVMGLPTDIVFFC